MVGASPPDVFALLADPARHPDFDGSGTVRRARGNPERLTLGAKFGMDMRLGLPYRITNTVVELEEDRLIAWRHIGGHRWRYELEPTDGGTRITETFDWSTARFPLGLEWAGVPGRNRKAIIATLDRIEALLVG